MRQTQIMTVDIRKHINTAIKQNQQNMPGSA